MLTIPLTPVASQTFAVTLAGQPAQIELRTIGALLYFSLTVSGSPIVTTRVCRNKQRLLADAKYRGFVGDFSFVDTEGDTDPVFTGLGSRYLLVYFNAGE